MRKLMNRRIREQGGKCRHLPRRVHRHSDPMQHHKNPMWNRRRYLDDPGVMASQGPTFEFSQSPNQMKADWCPGELETVTSEQPPVNMNFHRGAVKFGMYFGCP
jgi:hypothetical protein